LRLVIELRYFAAVLPELYVVTINQVLGVFLRGVIIGTEQFDCSDNASVHTNDIGSILPSRSV
jgi:hypothetical protein